MSLKCDEIERLLTPYVDGEAAPQEREGVSAHLDRCRPCAIRAAGERAARHLVQLRARALTPPAPPALRARCACLAHRRRGHAGWFWGRPLLAAAAGLVLVVAFVSYALLSDSPSLLVAGLTLDHVKCFAFSGTAPSPQPAAAIAARLEHDYGWRYGVPGGSGPEHLTLVGARRCYSLEGSVAHLLYLHAGKPVSLFVLPRPLRPAELSFVGHPARIWSHGGTSFILVASESDADLRPAARYFRAAAY